MVIAPPATTNMTSAPRATRIRRKTPQGGRTTANPKPRPASPIGTTSAPQGVAESTPPTKTARPISTRARAARPITALCHRPASGPLKRPWRRPVLEGTYIGLLSDMRSVVPRGASGIRLRREGPSQRLPAPRAKPGHQKIRAATASTRHDITSGVLSPASSTQGMISAMMSLISYTSYTTRETLGWSK